MLGDLDRAEDHLCQAAGIWEPLEHPDVYKVYANLAQVARNRGDAEAAAEWQTKCDAKIAELERLRRGVGARQQCSGSAPDTSVASVVDDSRDRSRPDPR
jgi:hypothetical protein